MMGNLIPVIMPLVAKLETGEPYLLGELDIDFWVFWERVIAERIASVKLAFSVNCMRQSSGNR